MRPGTKQSMAFINVCDSIGIFFDPDQYRCLLTQEEYGQAQTEEQGPLELVVSHVSGAEGGASAGGQEAAQCACAATGHRVITRPHSAPQTLDTVN